MSLYIHRTGLMMAQTSIAPITFEWTDTGTGTTAAYTYNFGTKSFGTATSDRLVIVALMGIGAVGDYITWNSCSVAGASATKVVGRDNQIMSTALFQSVVSSGTTGNVTATVTGVSGAARAVMGVCTIKGYVSATASDTDSGGNNGTSAALPLDLAAGGVGLWVAAWQNLNAATWTNATEHIDTTSTSMRGSVASHLATVDETRTATAAWSGSTSYGICAATWR